MIKLCTLLILAALTLGCAQSKPKAPPVVVNTPDSARVQLAQAANSVSESLVKLAEIEEAANPQAVIPEPPDLAEYGLAKPVSIDWSGPIEPLVKRLARANDYAVRVVGKRPTIPILITVDANNTPVGEILRNVHYQARHRADVIIIPEERVVEVRYPPVS